MLVIDKNYILSLGSSYLTVITSGSMKRWRGEGAGER